MYSIYSPVSIDVPLTPSSPSSQYSYSALLDSFPSPLSFSSSSPLSFDLEEALRYSPFVIETDSPNRIARRLSFSDLVGEEEEDDEDEIRITPEILFYPAEDRREPDIVQLYINWWIRLKPAVFVNGTSLIPADEFIWEFTRISDLLTQASVSWTFTGDPWAEVGTSLPEFRAFLVKMGELFMNTIRMVRPPEFRFRIFEANAEANAENKKTITAFQYFTKEPAAV